MRKTTRLRLIGEKFNKLTVVDFSYIKNRHCYWKCECECGNYFIALGSQLKTGKTKSCGCFKKDILKSVVTTHNRSRDYMGKLWENIKSRCLSSKYKGYKNYGARGITIYEPWIHNSSLFINWMLENLGERPTPKHSLDRIDNNGNYEPGNLRWANSTIQHKNRRPTKIISIDDWNLLQKIKNDINDIDNFCDGTEI